MAQKIITVLQQKGGAGKTTIAVHLATMLKHLRPQLSVVVADADPQGSASLWLGKGVEEDVKAFRVAEDKEGRGLKAEIQATNADIVVLDLPPFVESLAMRGVAHASIILIPIGPSELDTDSAKLPIELTKEMKELNPHLKTLLVPTRVRRNTAAGRELRPALERWGRVSTATIEYRAAYSDAVTCGVGVNKLSTILWITWVNTTQTQQAQQNHRRVEAPQATQSSFKKNTYDARGEK